MSEVKRLEDQLKDDTLAHEARAQIGERLHQIGDTRAGVGLRADGLPDIAWCVVGVPQGRRISFRNERGELYGEFALEPYYIARYPITFRQFQAFIEAPDGFDTDAWWDGLPEAYRKQAVLAQRSAFDNHPRDTVSWIQAVAFTRWLNARCRGERLGPDAVVGEDIVIRLPLEWEWQWAAQGPDHRTYPWGTWDPRFANTREARLGRTTAVGMYPQGAAWCGALDMSGNVWEWCLNEYKYPDRISFDSHNSRVLRGGAFVDVADWAVCASRFNDLPNRRLDYFGFRVACGHPLI